MDSMASGSAPPLYGFAKPPPSWLHSVNDTSQPIELCRSICCALQAYGCIERHQLDAWESRLDALRNDTDKLASLKKRLASMKFPLTFQDLSSLLGDDSTRQSVGIAPAHLPMLVNVDSRVVPHATTVTGPPHLSWPAAFPPISPHVTVYPQPQPMGISQQSFQAYPQFALVFAQPTQYPPASFQPAQAAEETSEPRTATQDAARRRDIAAQNAFLNCMTGQEDESFYSLDGLAKTVLQDGAATAYARLFLTQDVRRDKDPTLTTLPAKFLTYKIDDNLTLPMSLMPRLKTGLVRVEYLYLLRDLVGMCAQYSEDDDQWPCTCASETPPEYFDVASIYVEDKKSPLGEADIEIPKYEDENFVENINDYLRQLIEDFVAIGEKECRGAVWVTGHPGIGKSVFMSLLCIIRILTRAPTFIIQFSSSSSDALYYDGTEIKPFALSKWRILASDLLKKQTWILVDLTAADSQSDAATNALNRFITDTECFCVVASSTNTPADVSLLQTYGHLCTWVMRPPPIAEILMMRQLGTASFAEKQIEQFCATFFPVPRLVFDNCSLTNRNWLNLKHHINARIQVAVELYRTNQYRSISDYSDALNKLPGERALQRVLLTVPGKSRCEKNVHVGGSHIQQAWLAQYKQAKQGERQSWSELFLSASSTRGPAGLMLEQFMHDRLADGGRFTLHQMSRSREDKNITYTGRRLTEEYDPFASKCIQLCGGSVQRKPIMTPPSPEEEWIAVDDLHPNTYYYPASQICPVFDALLTLPAPPQQSVDLTTTAPTQQFGFAQPYGKPIYHAILFQSSVGPDKTPSLSCIDFLRKLFKSLTYVYVHAKDVDPKLHLPHIYDDLVKDRVYQMVLCKAS